MKKSLFINLSYMSYLSYLFTREIFINYKISMRNEEKRKMDDFEENSYVKEEVDVDIFDEEYEQE